MEKSTIPTFDEVWDYVLNLEVDEDTLPIDENTLPSDAVKWICVKIYNYTVLRITKHYEEE